MKQVITVMVVTALAGCGGVNKFKRDGTRSTVRSPAVSATPVAALPFARGPINSACLASDRKARSNARCGCIQAVANETLNGSQQRLAVQFYSDPHMAQEIRQSDRSAHEAFWLDYKAYGAAAARTCR